MSEALDPRAKSVVVPTRLVGPREAYTFRCTLDTGSEFSVLPALYLRRLGFDLTRPVGSARLRTATGIARAPLVRVPEVLALGVARTELLVAAHEFPLGLSTDGLLGLDFLRGHVLTLDLARGRVGLRAPARWWPFWK